MVESAVKMSCPGFRAHVGFCRTFRSSAEAMMRAWPWIQTSPRLGVLHSPHLGPSSFLLDPSHPTGVRAKDLSYPPASSKQHLRQWRDGGVEKLCKSGKMYHHDVATTRAWPRRVEMCALRAPGKFGSGGVSALGPPEPGGHCACCAALASPLALIGGPLPGKNDVKLPRELANYIIFSVQLQGDVDLQQQAVPQRGDVHLSDSQRSP